jgi:hypothetical protein
MLRYIRYDRFLREYRNQFISSFKNGIKTQTAKKLLTSDELTRISVMNKHLKKLEQQYIISVRKFIF